MGTIWALARKDLKLLVRDRSGLFFAVVFPLLYATFFGYIMSGMSSSDAQVRGIRVVVVNNDDSSESQAFVEELKQDEKFDVLVAQSRVEAEDLVRKGSRSAMIVFPEGFGKTLSNPFVGASEAIELGIDPGRSMQASMIQGLLMEKLMSGFGTLFNDSKRMRSTVADTLSSIQKDPDIEPAFKFLMVPFLKSVDRFYTELPNTQTFAQNGESSTGSSGGFQPFAIERVDVVRASKDENPSNLDSAFQITFPQAIVWGVMGCAASFGISLVTERTNGTLMRLRVAPISWTTILASKALACFIATTLVAAMLIAVGVLIMGIKIHSFLMLLVAILSVSVGFVGIMMLLSVLGRTERSAGGIGWAVLLILGMLGGAMMPLEFMPESLRQFASISPIKWSILALEGAVWRRFTVQEMLLPCGVLLGIGLGCFVLGSRIFRIMGK